MTTIDGKVRLYRVIQQIAGGLDRTNALQGTGVIVIFGNIMTPLPDLKLTVEGLAQLTDEVVMLDENDLIIPDHLRLTKGDRVALVPVHGEGAVKFLIQCKLRTTDLQPPEVSRIGYNGDLTGGTFCGVQVRVTGTNGLNDSVVDVRGDVINITSFGGVSVTIDGINFKHHTHPGGGGPV